MRPLNVDTPRQVHPAMALIALPGVSGLPGIFLWLGLTFVFARVIVPMTDLVQPGSYISAIAQATARVTDVQMKGYEASGSGDIGRRHALWRYSYQFTDQAGKLQQSTYYVKGASYHPRDKIPRRDYDVGRQVPIEYLTKYSRISRIVGREPAIEPWIAGIITLATAFGVIMLPFGLWKGWRYLWLLRYGEFAVGRLVTTEVFKTGSVFDSGARPRTNRRPARYICSLTYEFTASNGQVYKTYSSVPAGTALADGSPPPPDLTQIPATIDVLYEPNQPGKARVTRDMIGYPRFDQPGTVYSGRPWTLLGYLIIPLLVIGGHWVAGHIADYLSYINING